MSVKKTEVTVRGFWKFELEELRAWPATVFSWKNRVSWRPYLQKKRRICLKKLPYEGPNEEVKLPPCCHLIKNLTLLNKSHQALTRRLIFGISEIFQPAVLISWFLRRCLLPLLVLRSFFRWTSDCFDLPGLPSCNSVPFVLFQRRKKSCNMNGRSLDLSLAALWNICLCIFATYDWNYR